MRVLTPPTLAGAPDAGRPEQLSIDPTPQRRTLLSVANSAARASRTGRSERLERAERLPVATPVAVPRHVARAGYQVHNGRPAADAVSA